MFHAVSAPPGLARVELRALCLSLNTPVVSIGELPVGPTSAGIALHAGPQGPGLTLVLRSLRSGEACFFQPDEDWVDLRRPGLMLDAALSFAESMGFLFDEDPIGRGGDPREAARQWAAFLARDDSAEPEGASEPWLDEPTPSLSKFRFFSGLEVGRQTGPAPPPEAVAGPDVWIRLLSRF